MQNVNNFGAIHISMHYQKKSSLSSRRIW